jgi:hypothetical protein
MLVRCMSMACTAIYAQFSEKVGAKYPNTLRDADGDFLRGDRNYKLTLPNKVPAAACMAQPNLSSMRVGSREIWRK